MLQLIKALKNKVVREYEVENASLETLSSDDMERVSAGSGVGVPWGQVEPD